MRRLAGVAFGALLVAAVQTGSAAANPPTDSSEIPAGTVSSAELDRFIGALFKDNPTERKAAAKTLTEVGADALPAITRKLAEYRKDTRLNFFSVIKAAR